MNTSPALNFPKFDFRMRHTAGVGQIWDAVRKIWLVLTPEEWVRQHLIRYMSECRGVVPQLIAREHPVCLNGMMQRADVVIYGPDGRIRLVAECKAPEVELDKAVLGQVVRYNSVLGAPFVVLTNGRRHLCYARDEESGKYIPMDDFPDFRNSFRF